MLSSPQRFQKGLHFKLKPFILSSSFDVLIFLNNQSLVKVLQTSIHFHFMLLFLRTGIKDQRKEQRYSRRSRQRLRHGYGRQAGRCPRKGLRYNSLTA